MSELGIREDGQIIIIEESHWHELTQTFLYFYNGNWEFEKYNRNMSAILAYGHVDRLK